MAAPKKSAAKTDPVVLESSLDAAEAIEPQVTEGQSSSEPDVVAAEPEIPATNHFIVQLREEFTYCSGGCNINVLPAGHRMSSMDYPVDKLLASGAKLDLVLEDGNTMDLNELQGE